MDMKNIIDYSELIFVPDAFKFIHWRLLILSSHKLFRVASFLFQLHLESKGSQNLLLFIVSTSRTVAFKELHQPPLENTKTNDCVQNLAGNYTLCQPKKTVENLHKESTFLLSAEIWKERYVQEF